MDRESALEAIYEDGSSGNEDFLSDVEMPDASADAPTEVVELKRSQHSRFDFETNAPDAENNLEKIISTSEHVKQERHQNKRKYRKHRNKVNSIGNIDRFVINTCRQLKEPKSYLIWEAIRKLGVFAVQDFVEEVFTIECCGGQMTADGKRRRTPGGILWNILKLQEPEAYKEIMLKGKDFEKELRKENNKRYGLEFGVQPNSKRHRMGSGELGRNGGDQIPESTSKNSSEPRTEKQPESSLQENSLQDPLVKSWVDGIRTSNRACQNGCRVDNVQRPRLSEKAKLPVKHRIRVPVGYDDLVDKTQ